MSQQKIRISTSFQTHQKLNTEESHLIHMNLAHDSPWVMAHDPKRPCVCNNHGH